MTDWLHGLAILVTQSAIDGNAAAWSQAFGEIYANNGSGESIANEGLGLGSKSVRLQRTVNPGVVFGRMLITLLNASIRPALKDFCLNTLTGNRLFIEFDALTGQPLRVYQIIGAQTTDITDFTGTFWEGKLFSTGDLLTYLNQEFGVELYEEV